MMRAVHDREDARWLPSRHHYALFRLFAFVRLRFAKPRVRPGLILIVDRDQSQFENYTVSAWYVLTVTAFVATTFFPAWPLPVALLVSVPIGTVVWQGTMLLVAATIGPLWAAFVERGERIWPVTAAMMLLVIAPAIHYANGRTWIRFVAWQVLVVFALNAIAALLVLLLRAPIDRLERTYEITGGPASAN